MNTFKKLIMEFSIKRYRLVWLFTLITVFVSLFLLRDIKIDTDPENMLEQNEPARIFHNNAKKDFQLSDTIVLGIFNEKDKNGVFSRETLEKVFELTEFAKGLRWEDKESPRGYSGVIEADIVSPSSIDHMENKGEGTISFEWLMKSPPKNQTEADEIRKKAFSNQLLKGQMFSKDAKVMCIYLPLTQKLLSYRIYQELTQKINSFEKGSESFHIAGLPVAEGAIGVEMFTQMNTASPLAMAVIILLLFLFFRKPVLIILPLIISTFSILVTMAAMNAAGYPVHILSSMLPIFLMSISMVDCVHVLSEFFDSYTEAKGRKNTITEVMNTLFQPMFYTSLTTAAGFLSLTLAPIPPARVFGGFLSIGVMAAWVLTIIFVPAYIMIIPKKYLTNFGIRQSRNNYFTKNLNKLGFFIFRNSKKIIFSFIIIIAICIWGITEIKINDNYAKRFSSSHPLRIADSILNKHLDGIYTAYLVAEDKNQGIVPDHYIQKIVSDINTLFIDNENSHPFSVLKAVEDAENKIRRIYEKEKTAEVFFEEAAAYSDYKYTHSPENESEAWDKINEYLEAEKEKFKVFKNPDVLQYISDLQDYLAANSLTGKSQSAADIVKKINQELKSGKPEDFILPKSSKGVSECYIQYQQSHKPNDLWHYVTPDFSRTSIRVQFETGDSMDMKKAVAAVSDYVKLNKPPVDLSFKWAGLHYINLVLEKRLVFGFLKSFAGSFIIVFIMMTFLFRSALWGFLCMIPLSATLAIIYGITGIIGKDYDLPIAVLSALSIGMAVDFAIHFLERSREVYKRKGAWETTWPEMFKEPARAITRNVLVISVGFLPLLTADLIPYKTTGLMLFSIMLFSGIVTIILLPALIKEMETFLFKIKTKNKALEFTKECEE